MDIYENKAWQTTHLYETVIYQRVVGDCPGNPIEWKHLQVLFKEEWLTIERSPLSPYRWCASRSKQRDIWSSSLPPDLEEMSEGDLSILLDRLKSEWDMDIRSIPLPSWKYLCIDRESVFSALEKLGIAKVHIQRAEAYWNRETEEVVYGDHFAVKVTIIGSSEPEKDRFFADFRETITLTERVSCYEEAIDKAYHILERGGLVAKGKQVALELLKSFPGEEKA